MKKNLLGVVLLLSILSCQKQVIIPDIPEQPVTEVPVPSDSRNCTPSAAHISVQLDRWHADSALLQLPCAYDAQNSTEKYPLLVFLNGTGEGSNEGNLMKLKRWGPPRYMLDGAR